MLYNSIFTPLFFYFIIASFIETLKDKQASTENQAAFLSQEVEQLKEDLEVSTFNMPLPFPSPRISMLMRLLSVKQSLHLFRTFEPRFRSLSAGILLYLYYCYHRILGRSPGARTSLFLFCPVLNFALFFCTLVVVYLLFDENVLNCKFQLLWCLMKSITRHKNL